MDVRVETLPVKRLACLRHIGPFNQIGSSLGRLVGWAGPAGVFRPDTWVLALFHDDPLKVPEDQLRSDAGISVPAGFEPSGFPDISMCEIGGGLYAVATYKGSYEGLPAAWQEFMTELRKLGHRSRPEPCFEVYRNHEVPPEELLTDLYEPIAG